jgi:hypothetical protein
VHEGIKLAQRMQHRNENKIKKKSDNTGNKVKQHKNHQTLGNLMIAF